MRAAPRCSPTSVAGTGTLTAVLLSDGHRFVGVDFSPEMLRIARRKPTDMVPEPRLVEANAEDPPSAPGVFDIVLSRHVLWATADQASAVRNLHRFLKPGGSFLLIEGRWSTGAGLTASQCADERYALLHTAFAR